MTEFLNQSGYSEKEKTGNDHLESVCRKPGLLKESCKESKTLTLSCRSVKGIPAPTAWNRISAELNGNPKPLIT